MELEQITTAVRPRSPWEAMDLGFHLARHWWKAIIVPWLLVVISFAVAIFYLLQDWPQLALLLFWLLKPLYDRVPLYVLSRALFNATPSWGETIALLPTLLSRDLPWMALHRIDFMRSFNLPVRETLTAATTPHSQPCHRANFPISRIRKHYYALLVLVCTFAAASRD